MISHVRWGCWAPGYTVMGHRGPRSADSVIYEGIVIITRVDFMRRERSKVNYRGKGKTKLDLRDTVR